MKILVGYTGFVGSNIAMSSKFDYYYDSKNITDSYGTNPDLLVYSGVPAQKFIANKFPEQDMKIIEGAIDNIKKINPRRIVLISTIDVYNDPVDIDESVIIDYENNQPYGKNRHLLERWVMENFDDYLIVRLPGLYGRNIKKNFIYDLIHIIPSMLKEEKFVELCNRNDLIKKYYEKRDNGFYELKPINKNDEKVLKDYFNNIGFSALNFTDSRGLFQFYNLAYLWEHICIALKNNIKILNLSTEPVSISEIYKYVTDNEFKNEISSVIPNYNYKSIHFNLFNGKDGYLFDKNFVLEDIKRFIESEIGYQLSISNIAWNETNDEEMYSYISKMGFRGLEIAPTRIIKQNPYEHIEEIAKFSSALNRNYGLTIASIQSIWYGKVQNIFTSKQERDELIEYTKKAIDFASAIGCKNLVFGCPKNRKLPENISLEESNDIIISFLKEIGSYAMDKNTIFAIEANPTIYNTNFINTTEEALELVKKVNMESVKVNLDLGTMIENGESIDLLVDNFVYINHIHISEPNLVKIKERKIYEELVKLLKEFKYSNFVSIEMKNCDNLEDVKQSIQYIKKVFK